MIIDVLQLLINGEIDVEGAYDIVDDIIEKFHSGEIEENISSALNLDRYEYTAYAHALDLGVIAQWRDNGWPKSCSKCAAEIDYRKFGWTIKNDQLVGLYCCK